MRNYDCLVDVGGNSAGNEPGKETQVTKTGISAAEIMLLQHIHGIQAVSKIKARDMDKRGHRAEREKLDNFYGKHQTDALFGQNIMTRLPDELAKQDAVVDEDEDDDAAEAVAA